MNKIKYPDLIEYISIEDATIIQNLASKLFSNFNGGFGIYSTSNNSYELHQPINDNITISFVTEGPNACDLACYTWKPNNLSISEYTPYLKSIRYSVLEVLFQICKILEVEFSLTKSCINNCVLKFECYEQN